MKNKGTRLLAAPYLIWMGGFIVIPLLLVWYYAFTDKTGAFTLDNLTKIFLWENYKPLYGASEQKGGKGFLCGLYFYPAYVDEFLTPHPGLADPFGAKGRAE